MLLGKGAFRGLRALLIACLAAGAVASVAFAANAHFTRNGTPTCSDTGTQLVCSGELVGLGGGDLVLALTSDAEATYACGNPGKNHNQAPGVNKVPFTAGGTTTVPGGAIKNGRARFTVRAPGDPLTAPDPADICPNGNWTTVTLINIDFSDVVLDISQGGTPLFHCTYPGQVPTDGTSVTLDCQPA